MSSEPPEDNEEICGLTFDHKAQVIGSDPDGTVYWQCLVCDAEGWDNPDGTRSTYAESDAPEDDLTDTEADAQTLAGVYGPEE